MDCRPFHGPDILSVPLTRVPLTLDPGLRRRRPLHAPGSRSCFGLRRTRGVMSYEISEIATIRKYILGDLPESEAERIERRYFADSQTVDEVWAAFGEMAEEQMSGALPESESRRFEQRLRTSPALRAMFENELALRDYAARITARVSPQAKGDDPVAGGWRQWWISGAFFRAPRLMFVGVVMLIAVGALGVWLGLMSPEGQNPANSQQAKSQEQMGPGGVA